MCQTLSSTCCHVNRRAPVITASTVGPLKTVAPDGKRRMEASRTLLLLFRMGLDPGAGKLSLHFLKVWGLDCCRCFGGRKKRLPEWPLEVGPQLTSPVQAQRGGLKVPPSQNPTQSSKKGEKARVVLLLLPQ